MARLPKNTPSTLFSASNSPSSDRGAIPAEFMVPRIIILLSVLALLLLGFVMVYSASSIVAIEEGTSPASYLLRQLGFAVVGIVGCLVLWKVIPYQIWLSSWLWVVLVAAIGLLVLTAVIGTMGLGAQRWVNIGPVSLQPSEFAKIAFLLVAARLLVGYKEGEYSFGRAIALGFLLIVIPLLFLYRTQSDLGTTLICFIGILTVLWIGEVDLKIIAGILFGGIVLVLLATFFVGYRQDRLLFLNPWSDYYGTGYQLIHSFFAFSEGGVFGVGLGNSREKFLYLPEAETDFIFAIIGEELGLVGALVVIVLFLLFLYAGMRITRSSSDFFGMLIAGGCTVMVVFQAFLNIGCVIGLLPTTGKPLPFISSGGSSLIASLLMLGIILSVSQGSVTMNVHEQRRADLRVVRVKSADEPNRVSKKGSMSSNANTRSGRHPRSSNERPSRSGPPDRRR